MVRTVNTDVAQVAVLSIKSHVDMALTAQIEAFLVLRGQGRSQGVGTGFHFVDGGWDAGVAQKRPEEAPQAKDYYECSCHQIVPRCVQLYHLDHGFNTGVGGSTDKEAKDDRESPVRSNGDPGHPLLVMPEASDVPDPLRRHYFVPILGLRKGDTHLFIIVTGRIWHCADCAVLVAD